MGGLSVPRTPLRARLALAVTVALVGCGSDERPRQQATTPQSPPQTAAPPTPAPTTGEPKPGSPTERPDELPPIPRGTLGKGGPDPELFFLFPDEADARAAASDLQRHGYRVRTTPPAADVRDWSVIAEGTPAGRLKVAEEAFRRWAKAHGGRYDGNEIAVGP